MIEPVRHHGTSTRSTGNRGQNFGMEETSPDEGLTLSLLASKAHPADGELRVVLHGVEQRRHDEATEPLGIKLLLP